MKKKIFFIINITHNFEYVIMPERSKGSDLRSDVHSTRGFEPH